MMAGSGVNMSGAGMLRTRRRDISIKPNRRLDRKSSRGMIYENEELRLRTIHINAAIEQGQNDIKKLRKENEQLRREIWCLRDEYDKLEEILRKQKCHEGSDESESRSEENEASQLSNSERDEEEYNHDICDEDIDNDNNNDNENVYNNDNEIVYNNDNHISRKEENDVQDDDEDNDDEDDYNEDSSADDDNDRNHVSKENSRNRDSKENSQNRDCKENTRNYDIKENTRNYNDQLKTPEIINNDLGYLHVNFDGLSVVDEEEEQKKVRIRGESDFVSSPVYSHFPFIFENVPQAFKSSLKLNAESSNTKLSNSPKILANFDNYPRVFPRKTQQPTVSFALEENLKHNGDSGKSISRNILEENISVNHLPLIDFEDRIKTPEESPEEIQVQTNVRPKQIFAPLSFEAKKYSRQFPINEISVLKPETQDNKINNETVSELNSSNKSTEKRKSISLDSLFTKKNQISNNFPKFCSINNQLIIDNNSKLFSSCQNLNAECSPVFLQEMNKVKLTRNYQHLNNNNLGNVMESSVENNYDSLKPFRSQISVVLKSPSQSVPKEIPKNCSSLNNLFCQNPEILNFTEDTGNSQVFSQAQVADYHNKQDHGYQATSFEGPYPITLQIPSMLPIDYKDIPFLSRRPLYYPGEDVKIFYDSSPQKISAHTQTLDEDIPPECIRGKKDFRIKDEFLTKEVPLMKETSLTKETLLTKEPSISRTRKKSTKKEKLSGCEKKPDRRKKDILKKQVSISSCDESESTNLNAGVNFENTDTKHESRSSSSDLEKKEQTHRVSIYFNSKKRPSLTSMKSTRTVENSRSRIISQKDNSDGNSTNLGGEQSNSVNSKETGNSKRRKTSTSSENVPWCACWGNGCI